MCVFVQKQTLLLPNPWLPTQTSPPSPQTNCPNSWPPADKMTDGMWRLPDLNRQAKTDLYALKSRPQSVSSSSTVIFLEDILAWEESVSERWPWCLVLGENKVDKQGIEALYSFSTLTPQVISSLYRLFPLLCWPLLLLFIHSFILSCYCFLFAVIFLSFSCLAWLLSSFHSPCLLMCISFLRFHSPLFLTHLCSDVFLPPSLPFFMSFWPRSNFPNWLSGSLIILRHSCCRLFYLSACRHPNPLISKHPSSAHGASQQPTAFPAHYFTVHTDGPSTSSRLAKHRLTLRAAQVKDPMKQSSGTLTDQRNFEFVQLSTPDSIASVWWWSAFWLLAWIK